MITSDIFVNAQVNHEGYLRIGCVRDTTCTIHDDWNLTMQWQRCVQENVARLRILYQK